jgi:hypothetical protein
MPMRGIRGFKLWVLRAGVIVPDGLDRTVLQTACYRAGLETVQYRTVLDYVRCGLSHFH